MRIGLVQIASGEDEEAHARRNRVASMIRAAPPADVYMLPELWPSGFFAFGRYEELAEPLEGETVATMSRLARERGAYIHVGSFVERTADGALRNTTVVVDPAGSVVNTYSKVHGFGHGSSERELLEPGSDLQVSETPFGRIASTTCYDLRFPGLWDRLADASVEMVFVTAAWPASRVDHWRLFTSARAVEAQAYVVACNAVGTQAGTRLGGTSRVVGPWGDVVGELDDREQVTVVTVEPGDVRRVREEFPVLRDRLEDYDTIRLKGEFS